MVQLSSPPAASGPPRTTSGRLALNSVSNLSINLVTAAVSVFLTPFILRQMGDQRYGVWAVLGSLYAYSSVLQLGLCSAINRHIPMHLAHARTDKIREVTSTCTAFLVLMSLLVVLVTCTCADRVLGLFVLPGSLRAPARLAFYSVGWVAAMCLSVSGFGSVLSGYQRYELMALGRLLATGLRVGLVLAFLGRSEALICMALVFGVTESLAALMNLGFAWHLLPSRPLQLNAIRWEVLQEMFGYGMNTFVYVLGAVAVAKTGEVVVGAYLPPEHITYYTLALMPPMVLTGFVEASVASIKPAASDLDSRNDIQRIRQLTLLSQKYVLLCLVTAMGFFVILGKDFYQVWLNREVAQAVRLLPILAVGYLVHAAQYPLFLILAGRGEHRIFGLLTLVMGGAAVGLELFFCRVLGWGSIGVALGSTAAMVATCGVLLPWHAAGRLGISLREFGRQAWGPAACGVAPALLALVLWKVCRPPQTLFGLAAVAITTGLVLLSASWRWALDQTERSRFCRLARAALENAGLGPVLEKASRFCRL